MKKAKVTKVDNVVTATKTVAVTNKVVNKRKNSIKLVTDFMKSNPLQKAFVIESIHRYAQQITSNRESALKQMEGNVINGEAWVKCADTWVESEKDLSDLGFTK